MSDDLSYIAFLFGGTFVEYKNNIKVCFLDEKSRNEANQFAGLDKMVIGYWDDLDCYTLEQE